MFLVSPTGKSFAAVFGFWLRHDGLHSGAEPLLFDLFVGAQKMVKWIKGELPQVHKAPIAKVVLKVSRHVFTTLHNLNR